MSFDFTEATIIQNRVIDGSENSLKKGRDVVIDAPTGSGKSRMFSKIAENAWRNDEKILILSARKKLASQAIENVQKYCDSRITASYCKEGQMDQTGTIVSATVQTINRNLDKIAHYDRVIIDEAHHAKEGNSDYENIIRAMQEKNPMFRLVAVSATFPEEMKNMNQRLKGADKHIITFEEAISAKLVELPQTQVVPLRLKGGADIESIIKGMKLNDLDMDIQGIGAQMRKKLPEDYIDEMASVYNRKLGERPTLSFFDRIDDAEAFAAELKKYDINVETVHSRKSAEKNKQIFEDFEGKKIHGIVSVDMISEGYDVEADGIFLGKLTTSHNEYRQIVGRGSRGFGKGKEVEGLLIDMGASTYMHGEMSAQATISNIAKKIERTASATQNALPEADKNNVIWKKMDNTNIYAAYLDKAIVYATKKEESYQVVKSTRRSNDKRFLSRLELEGEISGRPSKEAFGQWAGKQIRNSQRELSAMITMTGGVEKVIQEDWAKNRAMVTMMMEPQKQMALMMQKGLAH